MTCHDPIHDNSTSTRSLGDELEKEHLDVRRSPVASPQNGRYGPRDRSPRTRRSLGLFTDFHAIEQINNLDGNRVRIKLSGFTNTDPLVPCEKDELQMSSSDPGFEMRMIMLLGAFFSGRKVRFAASQCSNDNRFILVGQIHVHEDS